MGRQFPEPVHKKHIPSSGDAEPGYSKKSYGPGHEDFSDRMSNPFGDEAVNDESGEGTGNPRPAGKKHPLMRD